MTVFAKDFLEGQMINGCVVVVEHLLLLLLLLPWLLLLLPLLLLPLLLLPLLLLPLVLLVFDRNRGQKEMRKGKENLRICCGSQNFRFSNFRTYVVMLDKWFPTF